MTETKFTPGPWEKGTLSDYTCECLVFHGGQIVAIVNRVPSNGKGSVEANANLIAAAPDLYGALEAIGAPDETDLVSVPDSVIRGLLYVTLNIAKDALAKARGEA